MNDDDWSTFANETSEKPITLESLRDAMAALEPLRQRMIEDARAIFRLWIEENKRLDGKPLGVFAPGWVLKVLQDSGDLPKTGEILPPRFDPPDAFGKNDE